MSGAGLMYLRSSSPRFQTAAQTESSVAYVWWRILSPTGTCSHRQGAFESVVQKVALVEGLLERGVAGDIARPRARQPGRCCITGCQVPEPPLAATETSEAAG